MRTHNSHRTIHQNTKQILSNVSRKQAKMSRDRLRAQGHVLFEDARKEGFKKVGFDVFQREGDAKAGRIWSVEEIDGEKWLVCYTDKNDEIIQNLAATVKKLRLSKYATPSKKVAAGDRIMSPGDLVEIRSHTADSINFKHNGRKGYVTAAMPDRTQLTFNDGSSLWIENKDLAVVRDAQNLDIGDTVRMFSRKDVEGRVTKFSHDKQAVYFENDVGQQFTARIGDVVKWIKNAQYPNGGFAVQNIWVDPSDPNASKLLREYMKGQVQQAEMMQNGAQPAEQEIPEEETVQPGVMQGTPPAIKAQPSKTEMESGAAVPAKDLFNTPTTSPPATAGADLYGLIKTGRTLNVGDMVQKKSTGQTGHIVAVNFDRKLGKFYLIDYGGDQPLIEYDTDIQKINPAKQRDMPVMPQDYTPTREQGPGGFRRESKIDPRYMPIKEAGVDFVSGMVAQALTDYETENPGQKTSQTLENTIIKQAIELFMSRYVPEEYRQVMSAEDKNEVSAEIFNAIADIEVAPEKIPTAEDFIPEDAPKPDLWDLEANRAGLQEHAMTKVNAYFEQRNKLAKVIPSNINVLREKQSFVRQATYTMVQRGVPKDIAQIIANHLTVFKTPKIAALAHGIKAAGYGSHIEEIFKTAADALALTTFTTADNTKYALDLPGMETLRGGGGGYPGGLDIEPMGWEVRNNEDNLTGEDTAALEHALNENLEDQAKPLEDAGPKINIELDPENNQIVIDYGENEKTIELESPEEEKDERGDFEELPPNMPTPGPNAPQPEAPGGNVPGQGLDDEDIPVNF